MNKKIILSLALCAYQPTFTTTSLELIQSSLQTSYKELSLKNIVKAAVASGFGGAASWLLTRALHNALRSKKQPLDFFAPTTWTTTEKVVTPVATCALFKYLLDSYKPEVVASHANNNLLSLLCEQKNISTSTIQFLIKHFYALEEFPRAKAFEDLKKLYNDLSYLQTTSAYTDATIREKIRHELVIVEQTSGLLKHDPQWSTEYNNYILASMKSAYQVDAHHAVAHSVMCTAHAYAQ